MKKLLVTSWICIPSVIESLLLVRPTNEHHSQKKAPPSLAIVGETKVVASRAQQSNYSLNGPTPVRGRVAWMLGCSLDSQAFVLACKNAGAAIMPNHMETWSTVSELAFKWCTIDGLTLVFTFHPGASPPPYYDFYTFNSTTEEIVRSGAKRIVTLWGKTPDAILIDSSLWDIANWWKKDGSPQNWSIPHGEISHWARETIPNFLEFVQDVVPKSSVAFRSPAPMFPSCVDPWWYTCKGDQIVNEMHARLTSSFSIATLQLYGKYHFVDYYDIVLRKHKVLGGALRGWYADTIHPGGELASAYMSEFLQWARVC